MKLEQLEILKNYTNNLESIKLLLKKDNDFIERVITLIEKIYECINDSEENHDNELHNLIKELIGIDDKIDKINSEEIYERIDKNKIFNELGKIVDWQDNETFEIRINDIIKYFKIYSDTNFSRQAYSCLIKTGDCPISPDELKKIINAAIKYNFELENYNLNKIFSHRTTEEIIKIFKNKEKFSDKIIEDILFDEDVLEYRTYEESLQIAKKVQKVYTDAILNKKIKEICSEDKYSFDEFESDLYDIANNETLIVNFSIENHDTCLDKFINNPSKRLYEYLMNSDSITSFDGDNIIELVDLAIEDARIFPLIGSYNLSSLTFDKLKKIIKVVMNSKSPFILETIINNSYNLVSPLFNELLPCIEKNSKESTVMDEIKNVESVDELYDLIKKNDIDEFDTETQIFKTNLLQKPKVKTKKVTLVKEDEQTKESEENN